ncbi:MAG: hypothetical protein GX045_07605 [Clostridiaceae bacterium]|jgi:hypothetical protein|nr:hypothetical protein [Clostridiaceae bacterium]
MTGLDNSITKNEYEEFMFLERKLSKEQKQAVLNIMTGIILGELAREGTERNETRTT